jgi:hypothetical protein
MTVDARHVYWSGTLLCFTAPCASPDEVARANIDGSAVKRDLIPDLSAAGLAADSEHLYGSRGSIWRADIDGSDVDENFITSGASSPTAVAVDDAHVYWRNIGSIGRANLDGSGADRDFIPVAGIDPGYASGGAGVAVDALSPPPPPPPSNEFGFGEVKKNKRKGTAKLTVEIVEGPGALELAKTKKVKANDEAISGEGATEEKLAIKPKSKAKKKLNTKGKAKIKAEVTYTPDGGTPNTERKQIKLVKR